MIKIADLPDWEQLLCTPSEVAAGWVDPDRMAARRRKAEAAAVKRNGFNADRHTVSGDGWRSTALVPR